MDAAALRAEFPGLADRAYLNAGTFGPMPRAAVTRGRDVIERAAIEGRVAAYFDAMMDLRDRQRAAYAARLSAQPEDVALTTLHERGRRAGAGRHGLRARRRGPHRARRAPGLLGPLVTLRDRRGIASAPRRWPTSPTRSGPGRSSSPARTSAGSTDRCAPTAWPRPTCRCCSTAPRASARSRTTSARWAATSTRARARSGCAARRHRHALDLPRLARPPGRARRRRTSTSPSPARGLDGAPQPDARAHDAATQSVEAIATALGAHDVLEHAGWPEVHERAATLAASLADRLAESGRAVARAAARRSSPGRTPDPEATRERLAEHGILLRNLPGTPYLRASVGAWNDEADLERLLATL